MAPPLSWSLLEAVALSWGSPLAMLKTFRRQSREECMRMFLERWLWQILGENIGGLLSSPDIRRHAYLLVISSLSKSFVKRSDRSIDGGVSLENSSALKFFLKRKS